MQERLNSIFEKLEQLIQLNKALKAENSSLKSELTLSRDVQNRLKKDLERLIDEKENALAHPKITNLAADGNITKEEIKAKIDQYISEIDNCIVQIEKL